APALLPDAYCGDVQVRLSLYKRLATARQAQQSRRGGNGHGLLGYSGSPNAASKRFATSANVT
ncbi:MAG: hypothetical protein EBS50_12120, partial [Sphingomonadaceae bacterium]|nr:hypothetical protein [Sphingomonadaceae bacterium]